MKLAIIRQLAEQYSAEQLAQAEEALANEQSPAIDIQGEDEGEQLTHAYAAWWIKNKMEQENVPLRDALRAYTEMVRETIN